MMKAGVCSILLLFSISQGSFYYYYYYYFVENPQNFLERFAAGSHGLGVAGGVNSCMRFKLVQENAPRLCCLNLNARS